MKRRDSISMVLVILACFICEGCGYIGVLGGSGGEYEAESISVESSMEDPIFPESLFPLFGMTYINSSVDRLYYYWKRGPEIGIYGKIGPEIFPGFYLQGLAGATFAIEKRRGDDTVRTEGMFGGGATYFLADEQFSIIFSYDNRRGISGGFGIRW